MSRQFDTPWKEFLDYFPNESLGFFFPERHGLIDWSRDVERLPLDTNPPQREAETGKTSSDQLYRVYLIRDAPKTKLLHWEIQSQYEAEFAERMFDYFTRHRDRWGQDPWSFAILGDDRPNWRVSEYRSGDEIQEVRYFWPTVKLWDWHNRQAELERLPGPVPFAIDAHLSSLTTRDDDRLAAKIRILDRLFGSDFSNEAATKLYQVIDWFLELPPEQTTRFREWLADQRRRRFVPYVTNWEKAVMDEGRVKTSLKVLAKLLPMRFATQGQEFFDEIQTMEDPDALERITDEALSAQDFNELMTALGRQ